MKLTHAGAVTFDQIGNKVLYLLISSSNGSHWVLPKGHIEANESPEEAALRELLEEAGIKGEILYKLPREEIHLLDGIIVVQFYLVRKVKSVKVFENREHLWVDKKKALELLSFEESKNVLQNAATLLDQK